VDLQKTKQSIAENDTIFGKLIRGEIPSNKVYEDDHVLAFHDIAPKVAVHVLIIPKRHIENFAEAQVSDAELLGYMMSKIPHVAELVGIKNSGFRIISNSGDDGRQEVPHLHVHIIGGEQLPQ
jgi:histidine triad (HIT) family protein